MTGLWWRLVRFGFHLLYNQLAFTYDVVSRVVSLGAWRCWQRSALKHLGAAPGARVLEIAHGTGNLHLDLHTLGYKVVGLDLSPQMGRITQRKFARIRKRPRLTRAEAQRLPYPDAAFQVVVSTFPAGFIVAPETLREVYRVLARDGRFVIVPNATFSGGGAAAAALDWLYRITGQRADDDSAQASISAYFDPYGLRVRVVQEPCPRSLATVVICEKTGW